MEEEQWEGVLVQKGYDLEQVEPPGRCLMSDERKNDYPHLYELNRLYWNFLPLRSTSQPRERAQQKPENKLQAMPERGEELDVSFQGTRQEWPEGYCW